MPRTTTERVPGAYAKCSGRNDVGAPATPVDRKSSGMERTCETRPLHRRLVRLPMEARLAKTMFQ